MNSAAIGLLEENERRREKMIEDLSNRLMGDDLQFVKDMVEKANLFDFLVIDSGDRDAFGGRIPMIVHGTPHCPEGYNILSDDEAVGCIRTAKNEAVASYKRNKGLYE